MVILVIGACASGKRTYAASLGYAVSDMADATLDSRPVIYNVQDLIAQRCMAQDFVTQNSIEQNPASQDSIAQGFVAQNPKACDGSTQSHGACNGSTRNLGESDFSALSPDARDESTLSPNIYGRSTQGLKACNYPALSPDELVKALATKEVVICNEVGSGVVPANRCDREARELVGRVCLDLAERAECVVRLVCGIPQVLKG